jgi:large conductance mechanosensitive channel
MLKEFREFAFKGNLIDMAVGVIVGAAFGAVAKSLVDDVVMPPLGVLTGNVDFANQFYVLKAGKTPPPYESVAAAKTAGASVLSYGLFLNTVINFFIVALVIFLVVKAIQKMKTAEAPPPATKDCPECLSAVKVGAKKCAFCTAPLPDEPKKDTKKKKAEPAEA